MLGLDCANLACIVVHASNFCVQAWPIGTCVGILDQQDAIGKTTTKPSSSGKVEVKVPSGNKLGEFDLVNLTAAAESDWTVAVERWNTTAQQG